MAERSFLESLGDEAKGAVEEYKSFLKNLGSEETRSRKELAEVLLKEDREYLKRLEGDDENFRTDIYNEDRIASDETRNK